MEIGDLLFAIVNLCRFVELQADGNIAKVQPKIHTTVQKDGENTGETG